MFNGMAYFYKCFVKKIASIMPFINKLLKNVKFLNGKKNAKMFGKRLRI
jgi:hypothetical protein